MARSDLNIEFNTFVGGILTEANPINYPTGYTLDEENFILERNGTRRRRFGTALDESSLDFDTKANSIFNDPNYTSVTFKEYFIWRDAVINGDLQDVLVVNYDIVDDSGTRPQSISGCLFYSLNDSTDISGNYITSIEISTGRIVSFTGYNDKLLIVTRNTQSPYYIYAYMYNIAGTSTFDFAPIRIRDFNGTVSTSSIDTRPSVLSDNHAYNLANSGWDKDSVDDWFTAKSSYPSLADSASFSKSDGTGFSTSYMDNTFWNTSRAPVGSSIIEPWYPLNKYESQVFKITGSSAGTPDFGVTKNEAYEVVNSSVFADGRIYYLCTAGQWLGAGSVFLAFSQAKSSVDSFANCYQVNDPTAEFFNYPLPTDGGVIDLSEIGSAISMVKSRSRKIVFGTQGVYEIFSNSDVFEPQALGVRSVTNNTIIFSSNLINIKRDFAQPDLYYYEQTANSVVTVKDSFFYWSSNGILELAFDPTNNMFVESNLSADRIDTLYRSIPDNCKAYCKGVYVPEENCILWAYSEDSSNPERLTTLLCYDLVLQAFYKFKTTVSSNAYIEDLFVLENNVPTTGRSSLFRNLTFLIKTSDKGRVTSYPVQTSFEDYIGSEHSSESKAFMQTGYINAGDSQRDKQADYIIPSFIRTEDGFTDDGSGNLTPTNESSCKISAYWDYADTSASGKIGTEFEAYRINRVYIPEDASDTFDYGQSVITTKNRLRGIGRALSLRFETSEGKDCRLLGWGLGFESTARV